jgi:hypothetical protein
MLHLRGESSNECFGGIAQIYAVLVSEFVRNASRARDSCDEKRKLTDGTVMVQDDGCQDWWKLTPDEFGSYVNGE